MYKKGDISIRDSRPIDTIDEFDFLKDYYFENEDTLIIPLNVDHIDALLDVAQNEEVWTYFLDKGIGSDQFNQYCLSAINNRKKEKEYPFVIFDKRSMAYAGMTRLYDYQKELRVIKMGHTWFGKPYWGTQLNTHCKYLLFNFIFEELGLERIGFGVHSQNKRSTKALQKLGCIQEGLLRNYLPNLYEDGRVDLLLFSILKSEWSSRVKSLHKNELG